MSNNKAVMRNVRKLLQAARRTQGCYSWGQVKLVASSRHHLGWRAFSWPRPDAVCTVDVDRHKQLVKNEAKRLILEATQ